MTIDDLYNLFRRWRAGHSLSKIAGAAGCDRKTVRQYIRRFVEAGISDKDPRADKGVLYPVFEKILPVTERARPARRQLERFEDELRQLIQDPKEPLKAKTAYQFLKRKYELQASYESFKGFVREKGLAQARKKRVARIELPPGRETQIDYGKMGLLFDRLCGRNRVVWAFCASLSHCRHPFFQYVYTQKQESFAESFIDTFEYYGGTTESASIDNLKAGVINPDLWDPTLNRTLAEVADYYGVFIDPCRVGKSTDKGKVERLVPLARELFRMLKKLYPDADLRVLNEHAGRWCREEYGVKPHGTTHVAPLEAFQSVEKAHLRPLPAERFEVPVWKEVKAHRGDGFFTFLNKRYAVPDAYRGKSVWVRYTERSRLLQVFAGHTLIRQYVVDSRRLNYFPEDFPEEVSQMMQGQYPQYLLRKSDAFGPEAALLIASVLRPHAYLNARRAQGMLEVMKQYWGRPFFDEICREAFRREVKLPSRLRGMLKEEEQKASRSGAALPLSEVGEQMVREMSYYL
jgi:transposase